MAFLKRAQWRSVTVKFTDCVTSREFGETSMVTAFVLVKVGTSEQLNFAKSAKENMAKIKGVKNVYGVFGRYDLVIHVDVTDLEELSRTIMDKMRAIPGVQATESLIIGF